MEQIFRRHELHDLVWAQPLVAVAQRFGMSDVGLAKICKAHGVPIPGRGHWAKLHAGKPSAITPLPERALGCRETIDIGVNYPDERVRMEEALMVEEIPPAPEFPEPIPDLIARVANLLGRVPTTKNFKEPHPCIVKLLKEDEERTRAWSRSASRFSFDQPFFASPYERRRLRLIDAVLKGAARADGIAPIQTKKNPHVFSVRIGHATVQFTVGRPGEKPSDYRPPSDIHRAASEPMQLNIDWLVEQPSGLILSWTDRADAPLETFLPDIVVHVVAAAEVSIRVAERQHHEQRVRRKAWLIEDRQRAVAAVKRLERERQARLSAARVAKLLGDAQSLRVAEDIRDYVSAVKQKNALSPRSAPSAEMDEWARWALAQADEIDPVFRETFLQPVKDPEESGGVSEQSSIKLTAEDLDDPEDAAPWHPNHWYKRLHR